MPWGVNRRRVVTLNDGVPGERSISVACMHCSDAPCMAVCPVDCFYQTDEGVVLHDKDLCIGCGYCFYACPFGAPQFPQAGAFGVRGKMDKCTFCAGGPEAERSRGRVREVRPQPPGRRQAAGVRRDVLDQGAARRRRRRDRRHLPRRACCTAARAPRSGAGARRTARAPGREAAGAARSRQPARQVMRLVLAVAAAARLAVGARRLRREAAGRRLQAGQVPGQARQPAVGQRRRSTAELRGGKWNKGDRTSWEEQIKKRQLAQNEYKRIGDVVEGRSERIGGRMSIAFQAVAWPWCFRSARASRLRSPPRSPARRSRRTQSSSSSARTPSRATTRRCGATCAAGQAQLHQHPRAARPAC